MAEATPTGTVRVVNEAEESALDVRQDELMTIASPEGQPPTRRTRLAEWRWLIVVGVLLVAGAITWAVVADASVRMIVVVMAMAGFLMVGVNPVLWASVLRGKEQREARKSALSEAGRVEVR